MTPVTVAPSNSKRKRSSRASAGAAPNSLNHAGSMAVVTNLRKASDTAKDGNASWRHRDWASATSASWDRGMTPFSQSSMSRWTRCPTHAW